MEFAPKLYWLTFTLLVSGFGFSLKQCHGIISEGTNTLSNMIEIAEYFEAQGLPDSMLMHVGTRESLLSKIVDMAPRIRNFPKAFRFIDSVKAVMALEISYIDNLPEGPTPFPHMNRTVDFVKLTKGVLERGNLMWSNVFDTLLEYQRTNDKTILTKLKSDFYEYQNEKHQYTKKWFANQGIYNPDEVVSVESFSFNWWEYFTQSFSWRSTFWSFALLFCGVGIGAMVFVGIQLDKERKLESQKRDTS